MRAKLRVCCFIGLTLSYAQIAYCTAFTIIKVRDGWVLGGDSRRVTEGGRRYERSCKIRLNKHGIALITWGTGWGSAKNGSPDLRALSQRFLDDEKGGTAQQRSDKLKTSMLHNRAFLGNIDSLASRGLAEFGWAFVDSQGAFGYQYEADVHFQSVEKSNRLKSIYGAFALQSASEPFLMKHLSSTQLPTEADAVSLTRQALQAQVADPQSRNTVSAPFSIVLITVKGVKWEDQTGCQTSVVFNK
jgi:hypothetical protein